MMTGDAIYTQVATFETAKKKEVLLWTRLKINQKALFEGVKNSLAWAHNSLKPPEALQYRQAEEDERICRGCVQQKSCDGPNPG